MRQYKKIYQKLLQQVQGKQEHQVFSTGVCGSLSFILEREENNVVHFLDLQLMGFRNSHVFPGIVDKGAMSHSQYREFTRDCCDADPFIHFLHSIISTRMTLFLPKLLQADHCTA